MEGKEGRRQRRATQHLFTRVSICVASITHIIPHPRALLATGALIANSMLRAMRRAAEMGREGGVTVANASGLVGSTLSAPPCNVIDPEGEVGLKDDLEEARHTRLILP